MTNAMTAMIVDDEPLAIRGLAKGVEADGRVRVVGSARSVDEASALANRMQPDLVFLDIQLQGETGFDLIGHLAPECRVIFVTAYDSFAVRAFEVNALDYLLKPVRQERLELAIDRIVGDTDASATPRPEYRMDDLVAIPARSGLRLLRIDRMIAIQADGDYSTILIQDEPSALMLRSLSQWEAMLPGTHFLRIHRSSIVNIDFIQSIRKASSNRYTVLLRYAGTTLTISQRYSTRIRRALSVTPVDGRRWQDLHL